MVPVARLRETVIMESSRSFIPEVEEPLCCIDGGAEGLSSWSPGLGMAGWRGSWAVIIYR